MLTVDTVTGLEAALTQHLGPAGRATWELLLIAEQTPKRPLDDDSVVLRLKLGPEGLAIVEDALGQLASQLTSAREGEGS